MSESLIPFLILVVASFCAATAGVTDAELARMGLTPRPKELAVVGEADLAAPVAVAGAEQFPLSGSWLRTVLEPQLGSIAKDEQAGRACRVELHKTAVRFISERQIDAGHLDRLRLPITPDATFVQPDTFADILRFAQCGGVLAATG